MRVKFDLQLGLVAVYCTRDQLTKAQARLDHIYATARAVGDRPEPERCGDPERELDEAESSWARARAFHREAYARHDWLYGKSYPAMIANATGKRRATLERMRGELLRYEWGCRARPQGRYYDPEFHALLLPW